jgi:predicted ATPase
MDSTRYLLRYVNRAPVADGEQTHQFSFYNGDSKNLSAFAFTTDKQAATKLTLEDAKVLWYTALKIYSALGAHSFDLVQLQEP